MTHQDRGVNRDKMVAPLVKHNIVKKRKKKFMRHQSDERIRIRNSSWRTPHGIDSRHRRRFRGSILHPWIGYGTNKKYRHVLPNGFLKFSVNNAQELEVLLMHNRKYAAEIASKVSIRKRKEIVERAKQLNIKVINGNAKMRTEEAE
eukprot:g35871.t1